VPLLKKGDEAIASPKKSLIIQIIKPIQSLSKGRSSQPRSQDRSSQQHTGSQAAESRILRMDGTHIAFN
jgi:hypothetical protein